MGAGVGRKLTAASASTLALGMALALVLLAMEQSALALSAWQDVQTVACLVCCTRARWVAQAWGAS